MQHFPRGAERLAVKSNFAPQASAFLRWRGEMFCYSESCTVFSISTVFCGEILDFP